MRHSRRDFLKLATAGMGSTLVACRHLPGEAYGAARLGVQLWTVRHLAEKNLGRALREIASIGYKEVEFAGYHGLEPSSIRTMLNDSGLSAPSAHIRFEDLRDGIGPALDAAQTLGHKYLIFAWIPESERTRTGYLQISEALNRAGALAASRGIKVGYHNYSYDFAADSGERMYDLILEHTDPNAVCMEMDVYWIIAGGGDPVDYMRRHAGRFELIHIKDMLGDSAHTMTDVGDGVVDWSATLSAAKHAGVKHFIIEHDEPTDPFRTLRRSYEHVRSLNVV